MVVIISVWYLKYYDKLRRIKEQHKQSQDPEMKMLKSIILQITKKRCNPGQFLQHQEIIWIFSCSICENNNGRS